MSYNDDPDWAEITLPNITCPECGEVSGNHDEVVAITRYSDYDNARHIPPELIFTCDNPKCPRCDEDFKFSPAPLLFTHVMKSFPISETISF
jgi:ribosomal protein S27AE